MNVTTTVEPERGPFGEGTSGFVTQAYWKDQKNFLIVSRRTHGRHDWGHSRRGYRLTSAVWTAGEKIHFYEASWYNGKILIQEGDYSPEKYFDQIEILRPDENRVISRAAPTRVVGNEVWSLVALQVQIGWPAAWDKFKLHGTNGPASKLLFEDPSDQSGARRAQMLEVMGYRLVKQVDMRISSDRSQRRTIYSHEYSWSSLWGETLPAFKKPKVEDLEAYVRVLGLPTQN